MGEFETGLCIWNHITISTVHHVIPYKCTALLSRPIMTIIVVRIFNFAVADVAQQADSVGQAKKRCKSQEERESSTIGTNCDTDGISIGSHTVSSSIWN